MINNGNYENLVGNYRHHYIKLAKDLLKANFVFIDYLFYFIIMTSNWKLKVGFQFLDIPWNYYETLAG